jgi:hypothetical protein
MFTMQTIARGFAGLDHTDIAWTDHNGAATQYTNLNSDEGVFAVMEFLDRNDVQDYRIVLESTELDGSTFRVDVPVHACWIDDSTCKNCG